jgi:hypothetical protein
MGSHRTSKDHHIAWIAWPRAKGYIIRFTKPGGRRVTRFFSLRMWERRTGKDKAALLERVRPSGTG